MELFAIDLGNKQVKLKSRKTTKILPSYFIEASEYGKRGAIGVSRNSEKLTSDYKSARDSEFIYVWGTKLDVARKLITDTIAFEQRYNSLDFKLLVDFALSELAKDFPASKKGILEVCVVTGVPTNDYEREETFKMITEAMKGVHHVSIDGVDIVVNVKDVYVLIQSTGTAIDIMVSDQEDSGYFIETNYVGIVDCGGGTVLIDSFEQMNLDTKNRTQLEIGSHKLFTDVRNTLIESGHKISDHEVETIIRNGSLETGYFWSPNGIVNHDVTDIIQKERTKYTRTLLQQIKNTYKDFDRMSIIYFTGGGSNLLIHDTVHNAFQNAKFVENSEIANVNGYYKWGVMNEVTKIDGEEN